MAGTILAGAICLVAGLVIGFLFGGKAKAQVAALEGRIKTLEAKL